MFVAPAAKDHFLKRGEDVGVRDVTPPVLDISGSRRATRLWMSVLICGFQPSKHFDLVGQNRQVGQFQDGMLRELLGVVSIGASVEDDPLRFHHHTQIPNAITETSLHQRFQVFFPNPDALTE